MEFKDFRNSKDFKDSKDSKDFKDPKDFKDLKPPLKIQNPKTRNLFLLSLIHDFHTFLKRE